MVLKHFKQGLKDFVWEFTDRFRRTVLDDFANLKTSEEECRRQIRILLEYGLIQENRASQYSLLVPKANGKWRFCVDSTDLKITSIEGLG